ncbi:MAG: hypothetical protein V3T70_09425, partial [Phycisphaerae bacterium]
RDNSFMHCLELVLQAVGRPIGYEELMGLSGAAFRVQFRVDTWCPSSPDAHAGFDCVAPVMAAAGLDHQLYYTSRDSAQEVQRLRRDIVTSIDDGIPVLANNIMPPADWGIITGYRYKGREWFCRAYAEDARELDRTARGWPLAVVIISQIKPIEDMRPAYVESIRRAVELFEAPLADDYYLGRKAFEHWSRQLMRVIDRSYLQPNAWTYASLVDARLAAVHYLRDIAPKLPPHTATLQQAADLYGREAALLDANRTDVPFPDEAPFGIPPATMRRRQADTLRQAMELEAQAIELLKKIK